MENEYKMINSELVKINKFTKEEIKSIFGSNDWDRTFNNPDFMKSVGLTAPLTTFLVAGSYSSIPTDDGKIAGICILRTDKKDHSKGFPVNWNHWDFYLIEDNKVMMVPDNQKRPDHWFKTEEEWKDRIKRNPPHKDKINLESQNAKNNN